MHSSEATVSACVRSISDGEEKRGGEGSRRGQRPNPERFPNMGTWRETYAFIYLVKIA